MQNRLETQLIEIVRSSSKSDNEKSIELKKCITAIKECKDIPAPNINATDDDFDFSSSLGWTAYYNNYLCTTLLLDANVDVNQVDGDKNTALHWAAYKASQKTARLLLENKADINFKNKYGATPLEDMFLSPSPLLSLDFIHLFLSRGAYANKRFDCMLYYIQRKSSENIELAYYCLSLLRDQYENNNNPTDKVKHDSEYKQIMQLLESLPIPQAVQYRHKFIKHEIDDTINSGTFPTDLLDIITAYGKPIGHSPLLFYHAKTQKISKNPKTEIKPSR